MAGRARRAAGAWVRVQGALSFLCANPPALTSLLLRRSILPEATKSASPEVSSELSCDLRTTLLTRCACGQVFKALVHSAAPEPGVTTCWKDSRGRDLCIGQEC